MTATERIELDLRLLADPDLKELCASALGGVQPGVRNPGNLQQALGHACGVFFFAKCLCAAYSIAGSERDLILASCLIAGLGRLADRGALSARLAPVPLAVVRCLGICRRIAACRGGARKYDQLFRDGDRLEIVVALALLLKASCGVFPG